MLFDAAHAPEIGQWTIELGKRPDQTVLERRGKGRQLDTAPKLPQRDHQNLDIGPHTNSQLSLLRFSALEAPALQGHEQTGILRATQRLLDHAAPRRSDSAHLCDAPSRRNADRTDLIESDDSCRVFIVVSQAPEASPLPPEDSTEFCIPFL